MKYLSFALAALGVAFCALFFASCSDPASQVAPSAAPATALVVVADTPSAAPSLCRASVVDFAPNLGADGIVTFYRPKSGEAFSVEIEKRGEDGQFRSDAVLNVTSLASARWVLETSSLYRARGRQAFPACGTFGPFSGWVEFSR